MLYLGLGMIVSVPVFKTLTHLPPYVGMMLAMGVVWLVSEYIHPEEDFTQERRHLYSAHKALSRIEMSSIYFSLILRQCLRFGLWTTEVNRLNIALSAESFGAIPNQDVVVILL